MAPTRQRLLRALEELATLLEIDGANSFKVTAYHKAVRALDNDSVDVAQLVADGELTSVDGIGKGLAEKITEFWNEEAIEELEELRARYPASLVETTRINGFGAKKARVVFDELGIATIEALEEACRDGRVAKLKGFGEKTAEKILQNIALLRRHSGRFRLDVARGAAHPILETLRHHPDVERVEAAGSLRRWRETVKDIDFVCATRDPAAVMQAFVNIPGVESVTGRGDTKASVVLESGMAADLRCVAPGQFACALAHFTGSKEHNVRLRQIAQDKGLKLNEYGLFPDGSDESLPIGSEADLHAKLGMKQFVEPELREDLGEIDAALEGALPKLVVREDLRGLLHMHTEASDGIPTLEHYAQWAAANDIEWMGIADHSQSAGYAGGLKPDRVRKQWEQIDAVNRRWTSRKVTLLKGIESDILADGSLDYDDELLAGFDFVVASVHSRFELGEDEQTKRVLRAIENPFTTVLGHMTGRLLLRRDGYAVRQKDILAACARHGVIVEINANPHRLDIDWRLIRHGAELGCLFSIGPDAHDIAGLEDARFGVAMARKGWLTKKSIVNCLSAKDFLALARKRRRS